MRRSSREGKLLEHSSFGSEGGVDGEGGQQEDKGRLAKGGLDEAGCSVGKVGVPGRGHAHGVRRGLTSRWAEFPTCYLLLPLTLFPRHSGFKVLGDSAGLHHVMG